jgi:hypothetical protein
MADGLFNTIYKKIPTNIRLVGEQLAGVSKPITEKDFSPEELSFIRSQIESQEKKNIQKQTSLENSLPEFDKEQYRNQPSYQNVKSLVQKELDTYLKSQGKTAINYNNYLQNPGELGWIDSVKKSFTSPEFRVSTSLGQYVGIRNPDGTLSVVDKYNWDNEKKLLSSLQKSDYPDFLKEVLTNPASTLATALARFMPETKERKVNIKLENPNYQDPFGDTTK